MRTRHWSILALCMLAVSIGHAADKPAADKPADKPKYDTKPATPPKADGNWTGKWGPFNPAKSTEVDDAKCKIIDAKVTEKDGVWSATFEGECGRPYKYTIKMEGRQAGSVVLFKGTSDLGPKDGGVYDWIGRATDTEFVGFYTSGHYSGFFQMKRPKATATTVAK